MFFEDLSYNFLIQKQIHLFGAVFFKVFKWVSWWRKGVNTILPFISDTSSLFSQKRKFSSNYA